MDNNQKQFMSRDKEILREAKAYATEAVAEDHYGNDITGVNEMKKDAFINGAEWADAHPSINSKQKNCQRILIEEYKGEIEIKWDAKSKEDVKNILEYVLTNFEKIVLT